MEEQKSFSQRVKETVIQCADLYKKYYVEYEYLLCSKVFEKNEYYIVSAHEDNYLHLTGLHTNLDAALFFEKCYNGSLEESDFDFCKKGQNEKEVKGSVRRKINSLPSIMNMFSTGTSVEEDFEKNRMHIHSGAVERMNGITVQFVGGVGLITLSEISTYPVGFTLYIDKPEIYKPEGVEITLFSDFNYDDEREVEIIIPKLESNIFFSGDYRTKKEIENTIQGICVEDWYKYMNHV